MVLYDYWMIAAESQGSQISSLQGLRRKDSLYIPNEYARQVLLDLNNDIRFWGWIEQMGDIIGLDEYEILLSFRPNFSEVISKYEGGPSALLARILQALRLVVYHNFRIPANVIRVLGETTMMTLAGILTKPDPSHPLPGSLVEFCELVLKRSVERKDISTPLLLFFRYLWMHPDMIDSFGLSPIFGPDNIESDNIGSDNIGGIWEIIRQQEEEVLPWINIIRRFDEAGYLYHYFAYVNPENVMYQAQIGDLELKPEYYEHLARARLTKYEPSVASISNLPPGRLEKQLALDPAWSKNMHFGGWSKDKLRDAINTLARTSYSTGWSRDVTVIDPKTGNNVPYLFPRPVLGQIKYSPRPFEGKYTLPGFGRLLYAPRDYYEQIYRSLFKTTRFLDWQSIGARGLLPDHVVRYVAMYDYRIATHQIGSKRGWNLILHHHYMLDRIGGGK